ncbi:MAG: CDP-diacylglycerol--glycerol-3-phosphate 3-phosphatidyltransferase [Pseudomonadota bacterium]
MTLATWLTLSRILLSLPVAFALLVGEGVWAATLLAIAAITDFLDGYLARARNEVTEMGAALDPIADKLLTLSALVSFVAINTVAGFHLIAVLAILLREAFVSGLREAMAGKSSLPVTKLAKLKTTLQFFALFGLCFGPSLWGLALLWAAAGLTLWTGWQYFSQWKTILLSD